LTSIDVDAPALIKLAEEKLDAGDYAACNGLCEQILAEHPHFNRAHFIKAKAMMPGLRYDQILNRVHWHLKPQSYVEIGVARGGSMTRVAPETRAIGIDPAPRIDRPITARAKIYPVESDAFFERYDLLEELGVNKLDVAFIDGLHIFEQALRDFINLERYSQPDTVILIHDCYPPTELSAAREAVTDYWCGDVWRLIAVLCRHRPELAVSVIPTFPSGLGVVTGLDSGSTLLSAHYDEFVEEALALPYPATQRDREQWLPMLANDWEVISQAIGCAVGASGPEAAGVS
jgi:Methyltransferase domain